MKSEQEKFNRFAGIMNKARHESNEKDHPEPETIYRYASRSLSAAQIEELADHLEHCWHCGEVLVDAEEFQSTCREIDSGLLTLDVNIPNLAELYDAASVNSVPDLRSGAKEAFEQNWTAIIDLIQAVASRFNPLIPGFAGSLTSTFPSMAVQFEGRTIDLSLFKDDEEEAIEVYSDDAGLDGNSLILQSSISGRTIVSEFRKHAATPGMAVKTRFRVPKDITFEEIRSLEPRIEKVV